LEAVISRAEAEIARLANDESLKDDFKAERIREIAAARDEEARPLIEAAREEIAKDKQRGNVALYKLRRAQGPASAEEWQEAALRAPFVAREVEEIELGQLPAYYITARDAGDRIGAWLIGQNGLARAGQGAGKGENGLSPAAVGAQAVKLELEELILTPIREAEAKLRGQVQETELELNKLIARMTRANFRGRAYRM